MKLRLPFPWIYLADFILCFVLLTGLFAAISFCLAAPAANLGVEGALLPGDWEAAVSNFGRFYRWYLPGNHKMELSLIVSAVFLSALGLVSLRKQEACLKSDNPSTKNSHNLASLLVLWALMLSELVLSRYGLSFYTPV